MGPGLILAWVALGLSLAGWLVLWRMPACGAGRRTVGRRTVSVIIPARNEEENVPRLLRSIGEQEFRPCEVLVVDDGSTDRTAAVALQAGARVIPSAALPEAWRGKTWACQQGAEAACGDLLLFLDADVWFEPGGLGRILEEHEGGALSVGPYHEVIRPYEQLSAFFNLVMAAGTGAFAAFRGEAVGMFGQMLLIDRDSYRRAGGHESVKGRTLENFWFAGQCRDAGVAVRCLVGRGALRFRMYPLGAGQLIEGWTKGFAGGVDRTPVAVLALVIAWLSGLMLAAVVSPMGWAGVAAYALCAAQVRILLRRVGSFRWYTALLYPVPLAFYFFAFFQSARSSGQLVTWKGRTIRAD